MSNVDRLIAEFEVGTLLRPSINTPNSVDLSRAVARLSGYSRAESPTGSETEIADLIGPAEHIVFVVADGLGMSILETLPEDAFLRRSLALELQSVFPSTTSAALTTLATGEWPVNHSVIGWWTHFAEIPGPATVLPFINRVTGASLIDQGIDAEAVFPVPSQISGFDRGAIGILPGNLVRSVYSGYSLGKAIRRGYGSIAEGVDNTLARLEAASGPSYTYLYFPQVDSAAHMSGVGSGATHAALEDVNRSLERLARDMPDGTKLVVTADHGHLDASPREPMLIREDDEIGGMLRYPPAGDARVNYYHVREDAIGRFAETYRECMPSNVLLLTPDEIQDLQLLGPGEIPALTRTRMGDYISICIDSAVFAWAAAESDGPDMSRLVSHHSGMTPDEVRIPLIVAG
ncbi:MAG: PglZ domain-containing protein [Chloroflexi bacterium]|jgi:hypothetical protein|nr:PglZ domain-containing protein [Chloroflexota bacterium]MBT4073729.1 PglZ domain-containing protein [Chloroflexota bacterium]